MQKLSVLFVKDGQAWTAQCLEYDIAGQGETLKSAMTELENTIIAEIAYSAVREKPMFDGIQAAPQYYWKLFEETAETVIPPKSSPFKLEGLDLPPAFALPELREYRAA